MRVRAAGAVVVLTAGIVAGCGNDGQPAAPPASRTTEQSLAGPNVSSDASTGATTPGTVPGRTGVLDGWNLVAPAGDRYTTDSDALLHDFGQDAAVAFGPGGRPVVVWASLTDTANNGFTLSASTLAPTGAWTAPTEFLRARLDPGNGGHLFSMAGDPASGLVAVTIGHTDDNGIPNGVDVLLSSDGGLNWARAQAIDGEAYRPAVAVGGGDVHVAYVGPSGYAVATAAVPRGRSRSEPIDVKTLSWSTQAMPAVEGLLAADAPPAVAVDADGRPGVAALLGPARGTGQTVVFWRPGTAPVTAMSRATPAVAGRSVALAFVGADPVVAAGLGAAEIASVATSTDGGSSFVPGPTVTAGGRERAPFGVSLTTTSGPAADVGGSGAVASTVPVPADAPGTTRPPGGTKAAIAFLPQPVERDPRCGLPRLAVADLSGAVVGPWTVCGPTGRDTETILPGNLAPVVVSGPDGKLYLAISNRGLRAGQPVGILLWRGDA